MISREEFREGCAKLNSMLHPDCQLTNIDRTLEVMDFDGSGTIDINEFFEVRRPHLRLSASLCLTNVSCRVVSCLVVS